MGLTQEEIDERKAKAAAQAAETEVDTVETEAPAED